MPDTVDLYDFDYPAGAVAQEPLPRREDARLLVVRRGAERPVERHGRIPDLTELLRAGDLLVLNATRVLPARLEARRDSGGRVSVLVLEAQGECGTVLLGARGRLTCGERLSVCGDVWRLVEAHGEGRFAVVVEHGCSLAERMEASGRMPLPPYVRRAAGSDPRDALDRDRYQTTFADPAEPARAVAAPTAGLHLTAALLHELQGRGVVVERLRLDVGAGTFLPLRGPTLDAHVMHAERYEIPARLTELYAATRAGGGRIVAVGTTVVRALESAAEPDGRALRPGAASTRLFLRPGHVFRATDALLTNFHQPRSTLLVLVSAFAGLPTIRSAYAAAIAAGYRLFSYGDAMLLSDE